MAVKTHLWNMGMAILSDFVIWQCGKNTVDLEFTCQMHISGETPKLTPEIDIYI